MLAHFSLCGGFPSASSSGRVPGLLPGDGFSVSLWKSFRHCSFSFCAILKTEKNHKIKQQSATSESLFCTTAQLLLDSDVIYIHILILFHTVTYVLFHKTKTHSIYKRQNSKFLRVKYTVLKYTDSFKVIRTAARVNCPLEFVKILRLKRCDVMSSL